MPKIHPSAIVADGAILDDSVEVGPFCYVGPHVQIGAGTRLIGHCNIDGYTTLGTGNVIHPFAALGQPAQDHAVVPGAKTYLKIGNDNVFSGLSSLPGGDSFVFKFTEDDYYGSNNQYPLVNPVEGRAIDGFLVALSTLPLDDAAIQDLFDSLNIDKAETDALYAEFAAKDYSDFPTSLFGRDDAVLSIVKLMVGDTLPDDFDPATMPYSFRS